SPRRGAPPWRGARASLRALFHRTIAPAGLALGRAPPDLELDPPVLGAAGVRGVVGDGPARAEAARLEPARVDAVLDQPLHHRDRAALRQVDVGLVAAAA